MQIICLEDAAFYALVDEVTKRLLEAHQKPLERWVTTLEAMKMLGIKSKTTLQRLRDEGKIRFSIPHRRNIVYDRLSIETYLESTAKDTF